MIEIIIVLALIILNGFFTGTEMAIISLRKTRIKELVKQGNKNAAIIAKLQENPEDFLATIQVGITLTGTIASAIAGADLAQLISPLLKSVSWPLIANNAESISFIFIIISITYLSVIFGELIPKSLGIKFSEKFALFAARPIYLLSKLSFFITKFFTASSNIVLKIFGDQTSFAESKLSQEELKSILYDSQKAGVIKKYEHEMLNNVFDFSDISVEKIMTPRSKIFALDIDDHLSENLSQIIESGYSRIPFYKENIDNIIGILYIKDLLKKIQTSTNDEIRMGEVLNTPYYIPNTQKISSLLRKFQKEKKQMAIVTDEHGEVDGLITIEDILEEIVGEISDEKDTIDPLIHEEKDGTFTVEGSISIIDFNRFFEANLPEDESYTTVSGFLLNQLEKFPKIGDMVVFEKIRFRIKTKTEKQIKTVTVLKNAH